MVNVNVIGRLGSDSEIKTSVNGRQYVYFRLATDQYNRKTKENETIWFNVIDFNEKSFKMQPTLKKGSMVNVIGAERIELYQGKSGETLIGREIVSDRIEFVSSGSKSQSQQTSQDSSYSQSIASKINDAELMKIVAPSPSVIPAVPTVDVSKFAPVADDDLPF